MIPAAVLVTDADQRAALAVVRSLGKAGYRVHVTTTSRPALAGSSHWARSCTVVPDALTKPQEYAAHHARLIRELDVAVLLPVTEAAALSLLADPPRTAVIPMTTLAIFRNVCDKQAVLEAASAVGIRVPRQAVLEHAKSELPDSFPLPAAIKPSRSLAGNSGAIVRAPVTYANDKAQLVNAIAGYPAAAFPLLVQERVRGAGLGVFHLLWDGKEIATFGHRRLHEKPPSGGISTYRESIVPPADLLAKSRALLRSLGLNRGVAMVEFKTGAAGEEPALMEINARFWGSLQLAIDAGVDFPRMLVALALGEPLYLSAPYKEGVRSRWFWGDVDHFLSRARRGVGVNGERQSHAAWHAFHDVFLTRSKGEHEEILRTEDPRPFLVETCNWLARR